MTHREHDYVEALPTHKQTDYDPVISTIIDFASDPLFLEDGYAKGVDLYDTDSKEYKSHLQDYAIDYCNTIAGVESEEALTAIALFASAPLAIHNQRELAANKTRHHLGGGEFDSAKDSLVQFNFLLTKYIEQHLDDNADALTNGLAETTSHFSDTPDSAIHSTADSFVQGIRTESGFKQVVDRITSISLRHTNAQEERKGYDFVLGVPIPTKPAPVTLRVNIKSSLYQITGDAGTSSDAGGVFAQDKYGIFKLYPMLPKNAYENGSFRVNDTFANKLIPELGMQLFLMAKSL